MVYSVNSKQQVSHITLSQQQMTKSKFHFVNIFMFFGVKFCIIKSLYKKVCLDYPWLFLETISNDCPKIARKINFAPRWCLRLHLWLAQLVCKLFSMFSWFVHMNSNWTSQEISCNIHRASFKELNFWFHHWGFHHGKVKNIILKLHQHSE